MRITLAAALAASLAACAPAQKASQYPSVQRVDPQVQAYEAAVVAYQKMSAEQRTQLAEQQRIQATQDQQIEQAKAYAEHRARAECSMRAQEANSNNWGLVHGFFAGLGTGSACINYYREIGVIR